MTRTMEITRVRRCRLCFIADRFVWTWNLDESIPTLDSDDTPPSCLHEQLIQHIFTAFSDIEKCKKLESPLHCLQLQFNYTSKSRFSRYWKMIKSRSQKLEKRLCGMLEMFVLNEVNCLAGEWVSYKRWSHSNGLLFCRWTLSLSFCYIHGGVTCLIKEFCWTRLVMTLGAFKIWNSIQTVVSAFSATWQSTFHLNRVDCEKFQRVSKKRCNGSYNLMNNNWFVMYQRWGSLLGREMVQADRLSSTWSSGTPKGSLGFHSAAMMLCRLEINKCGVRRSGKRIVAGTSLSLIVDSEKLCVNKL